MKLTLACGLLLMVLAALALPCRGDDRDDEGRPAPRFTAKTTSGEMFTNASVKGKVVLFQFWTTWCSYCHKEQKYVDALEKQYSSKGLLILAVDVAESKKTVMRYLQENPRACKIVLNDDTNLAAMFAAKSYPVYVAIDREGNIAGVQRGAGGMDSIRRLLRRAGLELEEEEQ